MQLFGASKPATSRRRCPQSLDKDLTAIMAVNCVGSDGVVVITSALHADGREFDPRSDLEVFWLVPKHTGQVE